MAITSLSYSSACTLQACEQKYAFRKILQIPVDADATIDKESFRFGKAFHKIMEDTNHKRLKSLEKKFETIIPEFELTFAEHAHILYACCDSYYTLHEKSELTTIGLEVPIETEEFIGYVDAVMCDKQAYWWIVDLKTSAYADVNMFKRLDFDPQLNLYAHHAGLVAKTLGLKMEFFVGVRYRTVQKPRYGLGKNENCATYSNRVNSKSFDIEIGKHQLCTAEIYHQHQVLLQRAKDLEQRFKPLRNRNNCYSYNTPCEYWSNCHGGRLFSDDETVKIRDKDSMSAVVFQHQLEDIL